MIKEIALAIAKGVGTVAGAIIGIIVFITVVFYTILFIGWSLNVSELVAGGIFMFIMFSGALSWSFWQETQNRKKQKKNKRKMK